MFLDKEKNINVLKKFVSKNTKEELNAFYSELLKKEDLSPNLKELLLYLVTFKEQEDYSIQSIQDLTELLITKYKEKILSSHELICLIFHLPCYIGLILNQIKEDLNEQDYDYLYEESIDYEDEYLISIYDLNYDNIPINKKIDQVYLSKNYTLKRHKSDKIVS